MRSFQPSAIIAAGNRLPALFLLPVLLAIAIPAQSDSAGVSRMNGLQAANFHDAAIIRIEPDSLDGRSPNDLPVPRLRDGVAIGEAPAEEGRGGGKSRTGFGTSLAMLGPPNGPAAFWNPAAFTAGSLATGVVSAGKWSSGIVASTSNQPPEISTVPPLSVRVGKRYEYQVEAVDPDGDELTFSLASAPRRMTVDQASGLIGWDPAAPRGEHPVELVVRDPDGAEARQSWVLHVLQPNEDNNAPQIVSEPPTSATIDEPWVYQIVAADPDDDIERFELDQSPVGMRIASETGRVTWTPVETGELEVTIAVVDEGGLRGEQTFTISVSSAPGANPPEWQSASTLTAPLGRTTRFQLVAFDADGEDLNYFVEPLPLPEGFRMNSLTGELELTPSLDQVGEHVLQMAASDGRFRIYQDLTVVVPPPEGPTRLRGRVQLGLDEPLPGVRLVIGSGDDEQEKFTDSAGYFQFDELAQAGDVAMLVDGTTAEADGTFATVPKEVHVIAGAENVLESPIILLPLDTASADTVDPDRTTEITSAPVEKGGNTFAPVKLTIPPGTARWEETGELYTGEIHITDIPDNDLSPQPLPPELDFSVYVAMQPFGVVYDEPIPISFPNVNNLLPGTRTEIFGLDHDTGEFIKFGDAEVSADGATVDSIGGVVVANSWHGNVLATPTAESSESGDPDQCDANCGSLVGLTDGNLNITHSTPAYQSLGQARAVTLVYNHATAHAKPIVRFQQGNASFSTLGPSTTSASLNVGGVTFSPKFSWEGSAETAQGSIQFDATGCPTEVYDFELEVTSSIPGGTGSRSTTVGGKLAVVNLADSPFGAGWHVSGLEQIFFGAAGDAMIIDGRSQATIFRLENGIFSTPDGEFSELIMTAEGFERRFSDGRVKTFDLNGLQIAERDRNGNTTTYQYDGLGRLLIITDPVGLETTLDYTSGKLARITDPGGRTTRFEHDGFGNLTRIVEPDGGSRTFAYDGPKGRIVSRTDQRGFTTEYQYNQFGRLEAAFRPDGSSPISRATALVGLVDLATGNGTEENPAPTVLTENVEALMFDGNNNLTRFKTDARGRITERTDAVGRVTHTERDNDSNPTRTIRPDGSEVVRTFDDRGNVLTETELANGATTTWTYDGFDQVTSTTDPRGYTTTFERDANGNLIRVTNPLGHETVMEYNDQGLMIRRTDPNGLETVLEYNDQGLVTTRTEIQADEPDLARTTTFEYTASGDPTKITTPTGTVQNFIYDAEGRPIEITDNLGQRVVMEYDDAGNVVRTETRAADDTLVTLQAQSYDEMNRLLEQRSPHTETEDSITQFAYDGEGNQTGIIDPNGHITVREYDAIDRLTRELDPAGGLTEFGYDARNQLDKVVAPNNATTTFEFDLLARQIAEHSPDRGTIQQEYDLADNLTASTDARGVRREMTYDALNRLEAATFPKPGEDISYTYDTCPNGTGRICRIDDESGTLEYEYDGFGNITRTTKTELGVEYVTEYEYDLEDRITAIVYPSGRRVEYERDILGRVTAVRAEVAGQMQPILSNIQYRADGQITAASNGNGLEETRTYDQQGRLVRQDLKDQSGLIVDERAYEYDPAGNITARTGMPGDQHYKYDALDRLTGQDINADGKIWQYDYGPNHNRRTRADGDLLNEIYSYQPETNRLIEIDKLLVEPDLTVPRSRQFTYNQANRFAEYIEDGQIVAEYTYNALGQRTRKELKSDTRIFHHDTGITLLGETDDAGQPHNDYVWLSNRPIAQVESGELITYLHTDHLLTPRLGTSNGQKIVWQWEGEAFGDAQSIGPIQVNVRFPGQYFDPESAQSYNYFRDYMAPIGRYAESDPIGMSGGTNSYAYVDGQPVNSYDPVGLIKWTGTNVSYSVILGGGGILDVYQLVSECTSGWKYLVQVYAAGGALGFGLQATGAGGFTKFEDNRSEPDPSVFEGQFKKAWVGTSFGVGGSAAGVELGEARSFPAGLSFGIDSSVGGTVGWSWVHSKLKLPCDCE